MNVIYKTIPRHTEENIPLDQELEIFFMIDISQKALTKNHIVLLNLTEQKTEPIQFEYNRRILKVRPVSKLMPCNHYQLQIVGGPKGIRDITGRTMPETYEIEFHTKDVEAIKPAKILTPVNLSIVKDLLTIQLEPVNGADHYELEVSKSNTFHNVVWPRTDEIVHHNSEIKVTPNISYEKGNYYIRVRTVDHELQKSAWSSTIQVYYDGEEAIITPSDPIFEDDNGENSETGNIVIQTNSREEVSQLGVLQQAFEIIDDSSIRNLRVNKTTPKDASVNNLLQRSGRIVIEFSQDIDPESVTSESCYLLSERN